MQLLNSLLRSGGYEALARQTGCAPAVVTDIATVLIPELFEAMRLYVRRHGGGEAGVEALVDTIDREGDGDLAVMLIKEGQVDPAPGNALMGAFYPDPTGRDLVIRRIAFDSGQDRDVVARMGPFAMMLLAGYLSARTSGSGPAGTAGLHALGPIYDALVSSAGPEAG